MDKALILHGWFCKPEDHWYKSVGESLKKQGIDVSIPILENNETPTLKDWTNSALKKFEIDENTLIIGHSLGAALAMKLVENLDFSIEQLVLVAAWDFWDLTKEHETFYAGGLNHKKIIQNSHKRTLVLSDDDPFIPTCNEYQAEEMKKRFEAELITIKNGQHFREEDGFIKFPQLLEIL
jgi:uncharacterized protein